MINREVIYERNITGSYMKIPVSMEGEFDERMMLKKHLPGLLPVEKCFLNGTGQYWYDISGKQSLDTYCRMKDVGIEFVERLIVGICNEIDILEWNLMNTNCLMLDPELVYISNDNKEFIFTIYPGDKDPVGREFRQLMEYLITKVNHTDMNAVHAAYAIYEKTLDEAYSIMDIRDEIIRAREDKAQEDLHQKPVMITPMASISQEMRSGEGRSVSRPLDVRSADSAGASVEKAGSFVDKLKAKLYYLWTGQLPQEGRGAEAKRSREAASRRVRKEAESLVVLPGEDLLEGSYGARETGIRGSGAAESKPQQYGERKPSYDSNPTVLLRDAKIKPKGILAYEGFEDYGNIRLSAKVTQIGQGENVDYQINRDTISHFHARIEEEGEEYYIEDLNSKNGTYVNDEVIPYKQKRKLNIEDVVCFADVRYRFY